VNDEEQGELEVVVAGFGKYHYGGPDGAGHHKLHGALNKERTQPKGWARFVI
jgi:hypothetical protein